MTCRSRGAPPPLTGRDLEVGHGAVPQPQRRVAEDDQIEHTEVARSSENRLGRRGYPQPADQVHRERLRVPAYEQPRPPGTGIGVEHGSEDRVCDGGRQPPAPI